MDKKSEWTDQQEQLLVSWAEKASGYTWLHNKSINYYKKRNMGISIPASIFGYVAGTLTLLSNDSLDNAWLRSSIGVFGIMAGILANLQQIFTFKELSEQHNISSLRFLSFFRDISCELSMNPKYRNSPIDYINMKRLELDKLLEQSPSIPDDIIKIFNKKTEGMDNNFHKPDITNILQTIQPYKERKNNHSKEKNNHSKEKEETNLDKNPKNGENKLNVEISNTGSVYSHNEKISESSNETESSKKSYQTESSKKSDEIEINNKLNNEIIKNNETNKKIGYKNQDDNLSEILFMVKNVKIKKSKEDNILLNDEDLTKNNVLLNDKDLTKDNVLLNDTDNDSSIIESSNNSTGSRKIRMERKNNGLKIDLTKLE